MSTVITGAARGIGLALTKRFAARGAGRVYGVVRDASTATELEELSGESSGRVHVVEADVTDVPALRRLVKKIAATDEPIDVLINNAGISNPKPFGELTEDDLREIFRVNASGPLLVTQTLRPQLARGAKIVNVTSVLGSIERAGADYLAYGMSKAALNMLSKKLALELRDDGIAVLALHPGWVRTRMGGEDAAIDVDTSADGMVACVDALDLARSGSYLAYDGSAIPW